MQSPAAPQKTGSVSGSTQRPPQSTCEPGQLVAHAPATQTSPDAHVSPAPVPEQSPIAPQNARSVVGSTHRPPHASWPVGQLVAHAPATQTSPDSQTTPVFTSRQSALAPQNSRSASGSTQRSTHTIWPLGQLV